MHEKRATAWDRVVCRDGPVRTLSVVWLMAFPVATCGCKREATDGALMVSAAMSLRDAFVELGRRFDRKHPGTAVRFNFASSGTLATQILRGAPVDVFASASVDHMDRVEREGLVRAADRHEFARNSLVIIRTRGRNTSIRSVHDLRRAGRVAIGNPETVPAGRYARDMLRSYGLWATLRARLVYGEHVRQVLDYVVRNEVDAGVVYWTDYRKRERQVEQVAVAEPGSHPPIICPVAVLKQSRKRKRAILFVRFLRSAEGRRILAQHGFLLPAKDKGR